MGFKITFHKLFEVRIYHAFGIKRETEFFELNESEKYLELQKSQYNLTDYLTVIPTKACKKKMNQNRLKFRLDETGFFVGIETVEANSGGGLKAVFPIDKNTNFDFKIIPHNKDWLNITNLKLAPTTNGKFHFSNYQNIAELNYPVLSLPPTSINRNRAYEMGEVIKDNGEFLQAKRNIDGNSVLNDLDNWNKISTFSQVTDRNRTLVPLKFNYHFRPNKGIVVKSANFTLMQPDGTILKQFTTTNKQPIAQYLIDLEQKRDTDPIIRSGNYLLEVTSSDGYSDKQAIQVTEHPLNNQDWGVISIAHQSALKEYRLFENNGDLRRESGKTKHPIFELRFKNRSTYWQYIQHFENDYKATEDDPEFITTANKITTKVPQPLHKFYKEKRLSNTAIKIPNPTDFVIKLDETKEKYISEMILPKLNI